MENIFIKLKNVPAYYAAAKLAIKKSNFRAFRFSNITKMKVLSVLKMILSILFNSFKIKSKN